MNKRSAMLMAAGLVLAMLVGGVAIAVGLTGPAASAATPRVVKHHKAPKPIVKTIRKTVTVHKKSPQVASSGGGSYAAAAASWTAAPVSYASATSYPSHTCIRRLSRRRRSRRWLLERRWGRR